MRRRILTGIGAMGLAFAQSPPAKPPAPAAAEPASKPKTADKPPSGIELQRLSVERQMQAVREHYPAPFAGSSGTVVAAQPAADCSPVTPSEVKPIIDRESARNQLDSRLVYAVVETESAYSPCAVSRSGAMGLMQLMPSTADNLHVDDPFDPTQNIVAGTRFLKQMLERYGGDTARALAAYNAGPGRVDAAGGIPPIPETIDYVRKIMGKISPPSPVVE